VRAYVGVTDGDWFRFVAARGLDEVNFWQPSGGRGFQALKTGELFLFKTHYRDRVSNQIVGGGYFLDHVVLTLREAWRFFGEANGASTVEDMAARIARYRREPIAVGEDPRIGCLILEGVRFFREEEYRPAPPDWSGNIVQGKGYETSVMEEYFGAILAQFFGHEVQLPGDEPGPWHREGPVYGEPTLARRRVGQGGFQAVVLKAYEYHCAVTGDRIRPVLQAAHIRPLPSGGEHRIDNGLLLRSDVHTLFDAGYLGVDPQQRLHVSPRLRQEFGNGEEFYVRAGMGPVEVPKRRVDRPNREFLEWHMDEVFKAS
jgi:putative restriction endonuclease